MQTLAALQDKIIFLIAATAPLALQFIYNPGLYTVGITLGIVDSFQNKWVFISGHPQKGSCSMLHATDTDERSVLGTIEAALQPADVWKADPSTMVDKIDTWDKEQVRKLMPFPPSWAEKWLDCEVTSVDICQLLVKIIPDDATDLQKALFEPLYQWLQAVVVKNPTNGALSQLQIVWQAPSISSPRKKWMHNSIKAKWPSLLEGMRDTSRTSSRRNSASVMKEASVLVGLLKTSQRSKKKKKKSKSKEPFEGKMVHWMEGWCGIGMHPGSKVPTIWKDFITERSSGAKNLLRDKIKKVSKGLPKVAIRLSKQLLSDIAKRNFAYDRDTSWEYASHGITPFAVPYLPQKVPNQLDLQEQNNDEATNKTANDIAKARSKVTALQGDYESYMAHLWNYAVLLVVLFGPYCDHGVKLRLLIELLEDLFQENYGLLSQVVIRNHIMWAIHRDARYFFDKHLTQLEVSKGEIVKSTLDSLIAILRHNTIWTCESTPEELLPTPNNRWNAYNCNEGLLLGGDPGKEKEKDKDDKDTDPYKNILFYLISKINHYFPKSIMWLPLSGFSRRLQLRTSFRNYPMPCLLFLLTRARSIKEAASGSLYQGDKPWTSRNRSRPDQTR